MRPRHRRPNSRVSLAFAVGWDLAQPTDRHGTHPSIMWRKLLLSFQILGSVLILATLSRVSHSDRS